MGIVVATGATVVLALIGLAAALAAPARAEESAE